MLVVHPHCVSGGGGGSATIALASPSYHTPSHPGGASIYTFPTYTPVLHRPNTFSTLQHPGGDVAATIRVTSATTTDGDYPASVHTSSRGGITATSALSSACGRSGIMFGHYDRKSFLSPRQERPRPTGADFRGLYHKRRVDLVSPPVASTPVKMQLDKFPIWGQLRRSRTDMSSSLPSNRDIISANEEIVFFAHRRGYTRQQGSTSYLTRSNTKEPPLGALTSHPSGSELAHLADTEGLGLGRVSPVNSNSDTSMLHQGPIKTSTPKNVYASSTGIGRNASSAKSTKSSKSSKSSPAELPIVYGQGDIAAWGGVGEPVASRSERISQLKAKLMPEVLFAPDGQIESGLYPATFKQTPGVIANDRRNDVFLNFGGTEWKINSQKPINYGNMFLPRVTCIPKTMGVRFRTEIDLVKEGKISDH